MTQNNKTRFTPRKILLLAAALILFSAVISVVATANAGNNRAAYFIQNAFAPGGSVEDGVPPVEGIDPLDEIPEGEIRFNINKEMFFPNGYALGDVLLHNPQSSSYALQFKVYLADGSTNVPVYTSPMLRPGQYISGDKLDHYLPAGTYDCTYSVAAYDPQDTNTKCGTSSGFVSVTVVC